jgi:hypothetical protein
MPNRNSEIKQIFENMLSNFLEWDGAYKLDSIDRALLKTEANSLYKISKSVDKNLRSRFIVTAKGEDLDIIGEGMNRPRLSGELDEDFRKRLIVNDTFFNDSTIKGIKNALKGYYGIDVDNDMENDTKIVEIYKEALRCGDILTNDTKFLGEDVKEGAIEVHLLMVQEGAEVIISRQELFEKIYQTRAAGILLYLYWHGSFEDNLSKKLLDSKSLIGISKDLSIGNSLREVIKDNNGKMGKPILQKEDTFNEEQLRIENEVEGIMNSRRVHRLLDGEKFNLPKDFQIPFKTGQRNDIILYNHTENITKEIVRIKSIDNSIRIKIDEGTVNGYKVILQTVPKEYNGDELLYFGDQLLTDFLLEGKWSNIKEKTLYDNGDIELDNLSEIGYYVSPPIYIENITKFGMVKWVYNGENKGVQIRTGSTEEDLSNLGDNDSWGTEYTDHIGEFIQETVNTFFQFRINLHGNGSLSLEFRLEEFFIEYWDIPLNRTEEIYDNVINGTDLDILMENSIIGLVNKEYPDSYRKDIGLEFNKSYWITNKQPIRESKVRNRRWTLYYGMKAIITDYLTRNTEFIYGEREGVNITDIDTPDKIVKVIGTFENQGEFYIEDVL